MAIPTLCDDFAATVKLYSTFIKQMKVENPQKKVSEVSFARRKDGKNSSGKRGSSGIYNAYNAAIGDRFFEKHDYHALTPDQKNTLRLKRLKRGHVGNGHGGGGGGNGNGNGKGNIKNPLSNHSTALLRRWLQNLTSSTFQMMMMMMMMMMMNSRRKRKDILTVTTPL
jgi:hypothetical protein